MERTEGLAEYIKTKQYRKSLGLPEYVEETYELLAQGEYNRNYVFLHPVTGKKLVLRINFGSQMYLDNQIEYEYHALRLLETSGRTPKPLYVDGSCKNIQFGIMVLEYLPGYALNYKTDLFKAAACLADIHSVQLPDNHTLIVPENPVRAILEECEQMVKTFMESDLSDVKTKKLIRKLLDFAWKKVNVLKMPEYRCCINTELNSTNFLICQAEDKHYLIDWEKPIYGEPAQDIGHFLAPTTTFWKTDVILEEDQMEAFVQEYIQKVAGRFEVKDLWERVRVYMTVNCLRGITWCAMAWIEYQELGRDIMNESTWKKLEDYLSDDFLGSIENFIQKNNYRKSL